MVRAGFFLFTIVFTLTQDATAGPFSRFVSEATGEKAIETGVSYGQKRVNEVSILNQNANYLALEQKFEAAMAMSDAWSAAPEAKIRQITSGATFPGTNRPIPQELLDTRLHYHLKSAKIGANGLGLYANFGQSTTKWMSGKNEIVYEVFPYVGLGAEPRTAFLFFVNLANNRLLLNNIPIPGFSYGFRLSPRWGVTLGFPYTKIWAEPLDWLKFHLSYEPYTQIDAKVSFDIEYFFDLYLKFSANEETYKRQGRALLSEQIIYRDQGGYFGVFQKFGPMLFDFSLGWEFGRNYIETNQFIRDRQTNLLRMADSIVGQFRAEFKF